jgi:prepilin peptidase CpaA
MSPQDLLLITVLSFSLLMATAAVKDLTSFTIPNWISLALVAGFVPASGAALNAGVPLNEILVCLGVGFAALLVGMGMFAAGWIGGGDAKLMAASALWLGAPGLAPFLMWTTLSGGALTFFLIAARRHGASFVGHAGPDAESWVGRLMDRRGDVPYGVAIAVGALAAFPFGALTRAVVLPF